VFVILNHCNEYCKYIFNTSDVVCKNTPRVRKKSILLTKKRTTYPQITLVAKEKAPQNEVLFLYSFCYVGATCGRPHVTIYFVNTK